MLETLEALIDELANAVKTSVPEAINICEKIKANIPDTVEQLQLSDEKLASLFSSLLKISEVQTAESTKTRQKISQNLDDY